MTTLPVAASCRVVLDNDWSGDPDGLVALAHHALSPGNRIVAVTSSFLHPMFASPRASAEHGAESARELLALVGGLDAVPVLAGHDAPFVEGRTISPAATAIRDAADAVDDLPLYVVCGGPLTNLADALAGRPELAGRFTLVWVGGSLDPVAEYNRDTDAAAADFVVQHPGIALWQFPLETYRWCAVSVAEIEQEIGGSGPLGAWLWRQFVDLHLPDFVRPGEVWPLGDSPPVLVTALSSVGCTWTHTGSSRVCTDVDMRLIVGDLLAKLRRHSGPTAD